jgi:hypothetical protein
VNKKFFLSHGNALGRMEAELDLFLRESKKPVSTDGLKFKSKHKTQNHYTSSDRADLRSRVGFT